MRGTPSYPVRRPHDSADSASVQCDGLQKGLTAHLESSQSPTGCDLSGDPIGPLCPELHFLGRLAGVAPISVRLHTR